MNKEELQQTAQKFLELKEPLFLDKFAPKIAPYARVVYMGGLVLLAITLLGSFIMLFSNISAALAMLFFIAVEFVLLRMFCEFLISYNKE